MTPKPLCPARRLSTAAPWLATVLALTLGACSTQPPTRTASAASGDPAQAPPATASLDVELLLAEAVEQNQAGIELIAAGEERIGEERLALARAKIDEAAAACGVDPACSPRLLVGRLQQVLTDAEDALIAQAERLRDLENAEDLVEVLQAEDPAYIDDGEAGDGYAPADLPTLTDASWITANARVEGEIDDWLTWRRPMLMEAWVNYQFLRPTMAPVYEEAGLPEALLFGMLATESGGKVHATSRAGATGPLQFMSYTGRRYGLQVVDGFDLRLDPESSTRANVQYLQEQIRALGGSLELALAAYNGGENRMRGLHRRYPGAALWDHRIYYALPRETRDYVPRIFAAARLFLEPERFNLRFPEVDTTTATLTLERDASVGELTVCLGQSAGADTGWFRTLRNLNPRIEPQERVAAGEELLVPSQLLTVYRHQCLGGDVVETAQALHQSNYPPQPEMIRYTVSRGDTLTRIASRYRCASVGEISALNGIRPPRYVIRAGQQLKIPTCR